VSSDFVFTTPTMGKVSHFVFTIPIWQCQPIGFYHPRHEHGKPFSFITPTMGKTILFYHARHGQGQLFFCISPQHTSLGKISHVDFSNLSWERPDILFFTKNFSLYRIDGAVFSSLFNSIFNCIFE
jgi:hypothetical protein